MDQITSNCVLKGKEKDYYVGVRCFNFDPHCPDESLMESDLEAYDKIVQAIEDTKLYIPYDKTSFRLYCLASIW